MKINIIGFEMSLCPHLHMPVGSKNLTEGLCLTSQESQLILPPYANKPSLKALSKL